MTSRTSFANQARAAARLAWRDLRRNPRSGVLVAALVALPSAAIMMVGTVVASQQATAAERLDAELGSTEARVIVVDPYGGEISQSPTDPDHILWLGDGPPDPGPDSDALTARDVRALLPGDARVIEVRFGSGVVETGDATVQARLVAGQTWDPSLEGPWVLVAGERPSSAGEVLVTPGLADTLGVAVGDEVAVVGAADSLVVSGVMSARVDYGDFTVFGDAAALGLSGEPISSWYVVDTPLPWESVQKLNAHGLAAYSRAVVLDPPPEGASSPHAPVDPGMVAAAAVGLVAAMLLAGAGFVVTFRRQQRQMALVGATGASRGFLAAQGVARGLWLGVAGGLAGVAAGLVAGLGWVTVLLHWAGPDAQSSTWGYHVEWRYAAGTVAYGAFVGGLSSVVPALVASRLDVVAVLRGSRGPARVRRWPAVAGSVAVAAGAACMAVAAREYGASLDMAGPAAYAATKSAATWLAGGLAVAFAGAAMLVSLALRLLGRLAGHAGLALRLATRDAARNAGRTVPVVAAVALVFVIAGTVLITMDRDDRELAKAWVPMAPQGDAVAHLSTHVADFDLDDFAPAGPAESARRVADAFRDTLPNARVDVVYGWQSNFDASDFSGYTAVPALRIPPERRCPWSEDQTARERAADLRCAGINADLGPWYFEAAVGDADALRALLAREPSPAAVDALESGAVVVLLPEMLDDGHVTIGLWDYSAGNFADDVQSPAREIRLEAYYEPTEFGGHRGPRAIMSRATAAEIGWPIAPQSIYVDAAEPITEAEAAALNDAGTRAGAGRVWVSVERGPYRYASTLLTALTLAGLAVFAGGCTAIALGLARADARRDDFTLASLGADPRIVRSVAAWQGAIMVALATTIGLAAALAWVAVDTQRILGATFEPPWLVVFGGWVALPTFVGAAAWVLTRVPRAVASGLAD